MNIRSLEDIQHSTEHVLEDIQHSTEHGLVEHLQNIWERTYRFKSVPDGLIILALINKAVPALAKYWQLTVDENVDFPQFVKIYEENIPAYKREYDPDTADYWLGQAVEENNIAQVKSLLSKYSRLDISLALILAVQLGHAKIIALLLPNKALYNYEYLASLIVDKNDVSFFSDLVQHLNSAQAESLFLAVFPLAANKDNQAIFKYIIEHADTGHLIKLLIYMVNKRYYKLADELFSALTSRGETIPQTDLNKQLENALLWNTYPRALYWLGKGADLQAIDSKLAKKLREDV